MTRPRHIWLVFAGCFTVLLAAMGWVSWTALRLDDVQRRAAWHAEQEEKVRLALWRLDSAVTPLILEESARPYQNYETFPTISRAHKKGGSSSAESDLPNPSPLLVSTPEQVLLHFQWSVNGALTSPQVPTGPQRTLAEKSYTTSERLDLASQRLEQLKQLLQQPVMTPTVSGPVSIASSTLSRSSSTPAVVRAQSNGELLMRQALAEANFNGPPAPPPPPAGQPEANRVGAQSKEALNPAGQAVSPPLAQAQRSQAELNARASAYQLAQQRVANFNELINRAPDFTPRVKEGLFTPLWIERELILVRRVDLDNHQFIQGCWLNWPAVKQSLLATTADLFPQGDLEPAQNAPGSLLTRTLAALPVKFSTGPLPVIALPNWSPVRFSLVIAWACILLAGAAVALLLHGTLSLSERRAAFVSAVTHELRTPLTTFKMYSEMLAAGMIPEEEKRRQYLDTLCAEANRLGHLVENVLAYARLERGRARNRVETVSLEQLLQRVKDRLDQRAQQAGMRLEVHGAPETLAVRVHADVSAVEQILFNLVDNACKYAAPTAAHQPIELEITGAGKVALLRVRDHGPGIPGGDARRLFQPFHKSAHDAAHSAPGIGLGLALCRRLSRAMGGDLQLEQTQAAQPGACFVLSLPSAHAHA